MPTKLTSKIPGPVSSFGMGMLLFGGAELALGAAMGRSPRETLSARNILNMAAISAAFVVAPALANAAFMLPLIPFGMQMVVGGMRTLQANQFQGTFPFQDNPYALAQRQRQMGYLGNSLLGNEARAFSMRGY